MMYIVTPMAERNLIVHSVHTIDQSSLVFNKPYPLPYALRERVVKELHDLLEAGLVEPSESPYNVCCSNLLGEKERQHDTLLRGLSKIEPTDCV